MATFCLNEFVHRLKHATLSHHHAKIDVAVEEFRHTSDYDTFARRLVHEVGTSRVVLESAYRAQEGISIPCVLGSVE